MKLQRFPKIKGFILKYKSPPPFWPIYIGVKRTTFGKTYGIKVRCYGDNIGEHIGNHGKMKKNPLPPQT
jgi:hypothetical protein